MLNQSDHFVREASMTTRTLHNLINGETVPAADGRTSTLVNPSTEDEFATAAVSGAEDVDRAMQAAAGAFETWRDATPADRQKALLKLADAVEARADASRLLEGRGAGEYLAEHTSYVRREPIGVVAQVTPWNYPLMMAVWKVAPALAAGNCLVIKPSDTTPASTLLLGEIAQE